ncbi:hypothetical protein MJO29_017010, partial [Puccinia striiformis f. sp. tritici]
EDLQEDHCSCRFSAKFNHITLRILPQNPFDALETRNQGLQMMPKIFVIVKSIMTGKVQMPKSEHVHSGYQYSFLDFVVCNPKLTSALKVFPSSKQIDELLKLAEKRAKTLIEFAGMQEVPGEESCNLSLDTSGQHGEFVHNQAILLLFTPGHMNDRQKDNVNDAMAEAALVAGARCTLDHELLLQEESHEVLETETV